MNRMPSAENIISKVRKKEGFWAYDFKSTRVENRNRRLALEVDILGMVKVVEKNSIKIGKEPVVILPLKKWREIEELLEEREDFIRYNIAYNESLGERMIGLEELKKKYNLK